MAPRDAVGRLRAVPNIPPPGVPDAGPAGVGLALGLLVALAAARYAHDVLKLALEAPVIDFANFYTYATGVRLGLNPFRAEDLAQVEAALSVRHAAVPPTFGPAGYALLAPLTLVSFEAARVLWLGLGQLCLGAALLLWYRRLAPAAVPALVGAVVVLLYQPLLEEIAIGNLNLPALPLLALAAVAHAGARPLAAALPLSLAIHLKPQYLLLIPLVGWIGPARLGWLTLALVAGWAAVGLALVGGGWLGGYLDFLAVGSARLHAWSKNLSPHGMLHRLVGSAGPQPVVDAVAVALAIVVVGAAVAATRGARAEGSAPTLAAWGVALAAVPLASPLTEEVHLVALLLPLLLAIAWADALAPADRGLLVGAAVLLGTRYSVESFPAFATGIPSLAYGGKALGAALLGLVAARLRFRGGRGLATAAAQPGRDDGASDARDSSESSGAGHGRVDERGLARGGGVWGWSDTRRSPPRSIPVEEFDRRIADRSDEAVWTEYYAPATAGRQRRQARLQGALGAGPGERVLDVGCGAGGLAYWAARQGARVIAIDYSSASLRPAARLAAGLGAAAPRYLQADATRLPVRAGRFDKVVCVDVLDVLPEHLHADLVAECLRAARPGGAVLLYTPNARRERIGRLLRPLRRRLGAWRRADCPLHIGLTGPRRMRRLLATLGVQGRVSYYDMNYPWLATLPGLRAWLAGHMLWTITTHESP